MNRIDPLAIEKLVEGHLDIPEIKDIDPDSADEYLGVLQGIAREVNGSLVPDGEDWAFYLNLVFPKRDQAKVLVGLFGLGRNSADLEDLFGERAGGWGRELHDAVVTDILASVIAWWVMDDLSRIGYLEAWAARGENIWKRRLAASTTSIMNESNPDLTNESLKVLRHLMVSEEVEILSSVSRSLKKASDRGAVERFVAWWQPRISENALEIIIADLDESIQENIRNLQ